MENKNFLLTVSAPSGTGKNTLIDRLLADDPALQYCVTATTRSPRPGEEDGVDYHFLQQDDFLEKIANGDLLEYAQHYGNYYGTLKSVVRQHFDEGHDVISDITWPGVAQLRKRMPEQLVKVLLLPPSIDELEKRLRNRGLKSKETEEQFMQRLAIIKTDIKYVDRDDFVFQNPDLLGSRQVDYDYVLVNDDLEETLSKLKTIIAKERKQRFV